MDRPSFGDSQRFAIYHAYLLLLDTQVIYQVKSAEHAESVNLMDRHRAER